MSRRGGAGAATGGRARAGPSNTGHRRQDDVRKTTCPLMTRHVPTCSLVSILGPGAGLYGPVEVHQSVGRPGKWQIVAVDNI